MTSLILENFDRSLQISSEKVAGESSPPLSNTDGNGMNGSCGNQNHDNQSGFAAVDAEPTTGRHNKISVHGEDFVGRSQPIDYGYLPGVERCDYLYDAFSSDSRAQQPYKKLPQLYGYGYPSPGLHDMVSSSVNNTDFFEGTTKSPLVNPLSNGASLAVHHSPSTAPYTPNLLPQSLLGTPPTFVQSQPTFVTHGLGQMPIENFYSSALPNDGSYVVDRDPNISMMAMNVSVGSNLPTASTQWMFGHSSPILTSNQPQMVMPTMQQLPPAAMAVQRTSSPESARYLRSENPQIGVSSRSSSNSVRSSDRDPRDAWSSYSDSGKAQPKPTSLLEELHGQMKHSPKNSSKGGGMDYQQSYTKASVGHPQHHGYFSGNGGPHGLMANNGRNGAHNNRSHQSNISGNVGHYGKNNNNSVGSVPWGIGAILGQVCEFAKDQHGSRFIQQQLESPNVSDADKLALFDEVLPSARMLCSDVFGNYVIQKLLSEGQPAQQEKLVKIALEGSMLELSKHMYACRVIQKLIEKVFSAPAPPASIPPGDPNAPGARLYSREYQDSLLKELDGNIVDCVQDQNGNHVIQKCIEQVRPISRIDFILKAFKGSMVSMAMHPYGCRVAQRVMENCGERSVKEALNELISAIDRLVVDQFANYVVQHIIEAKHQRRDSDERKQVLFAVQKNVLSYSTHKFASNVVEKCLQHGDAKERYDLIEKMLESPAGDRRAPCPLVLMMKDPYANYVVQKVIDRAENDQQKRVVQIVKENTAALKKLTYGKHILSRVSKNVPLSS